MIEDLAKRGRGCNFKQIGSQFGVPGLGHGTYKRFSDVPEPLGVDTEDFDGFHFDGFHRHRAHFFVMTLPHSDACFVAACPAAAAEAWLDGHNAAFAFFGGVPQSILYDNDKCLVSRILPDGTRQRTRSFSGLQSHYLFEDRYGRPGKGNDKGNVEGVVGYGDVPVDVEKLR